VTSRDFAEPEFFLFFFGSYVCYNPDGTRSPSGYGSGYSAEALGQGRSGLESRGQPPHPHPHTPHTPDTGTERWADTRADLLPWSPRFAGSRRRGRMRPIAGPVLHRRRWPL